MKKILLIRHGMTLSNKAKRYAGRTDEPLCNEGIAQTNTLYLRKLPSCDFVFASPYLRCRQTADTLFPGHPLVVIEGLRECDFGSFEGKTADELAHNPKYTAWLTSGCTGPIPGGESVLGFKARCCEAFVRAVQGISEGSTAAFVIHGGCIMGILEEYAQPHKTFYEYHIEPCGLISCTLAGSVLTITGGAQC